MYPISLPILAFIVSLTTYGITLLVYRRALVQRGMRPALLAGGNTDSIFDPSAQEGTPWVRDLFSRQPLRELEMYRLVSLVDGCNCRDDGMGGDRRLNAAPGGRYLEQD